MTLHETVAVARTDLDRLNELSMIAARGGDPGELTAVERVAFDAMRRMVEQYPGVAWSPIDTTFG